ncbi:helix-turn-helix transcriptional regulator [Haloglycomyces albus]|uniref:helix-turn-helix transcriptional regulator n=1 Tax=Haloglycomyces albus TaxID=526067 RepID=UPI00046CBC24|nr:helix-turn-helix transcriptional regulator [Haloglycomyces albus]
MLHGRTAEITDLTARLEQARNGHSSGLVVRGAAGIGKTRLLNHIGDVASDFLVLRTMGVEAEMHWSFAGLNMLLRPVSNDIDRLLPSQQAQGLQASLNFEATPAGQPMHSGLATLQLLAELSERQPVLCIVDDAQWLDPDSADALLFVSRRLHAERIVFLWGVRDGDGPFFATPGIPETALDSLDDESACALLDASVPNLPPDAKRTVVRLSGGNPLALFEIALAHKEGRATVQGFDAAAQNTALQLRHSFAERIRSLPQATQTALLLAAAEPSRDTAVILHAAAVSGISASDLAPAEAKGLIRQVGDEIQFSHPLMRTAAYYEAPLHRRSEAHRHLAIKSEGLEGGCRTVYHLTSATSGPDEEIATLLTDKAAGDAARGGHATEAATYELAASLSTDPTARLDRLMMAAEAALAAGTIATAEQMAKTVVSEATDDTHRMRATEVLATVSMWHGDKDRAGRFWFDSAAYSQRVKPSRSGFPLFMVVATAMNHGDFQLAEAAVDQAESLKLEHAPWVRLLYTGTVGLNRVSEASIDEAVTALRSLIAIHQSSDAKPDRNVQIFRASWMILTGDYTEAYGYINDAVTECRQRGSHGTLPQALTVRALIELHCGRMSEAQADAEEALALADEVGHRAAFRRDPALALAMVHSIQGRADAAAELVNRLDDQDSTSELIMRGLIDLAEHRWTSAWARLSSVFDGPRPMRVLTFIPDMIEAAARSGHLDQAKEAIEYYATYADATAQAGLQAVSARNRALLEHDSAEPLYRTAVDLHQHSGGSALAHANTRILFGEWLRRQRRNSEARSQFEVARDIVERLGAQPWLDRIDAELRALGASIAAPPRRGNRQLTPQEHQVAKLASTGLTNREIGNMLFLSPRTVGYHLYKAYPKLGIKTRTELANIDLDA